MKQRNDFHIGYVLTAAWLALCPMRMDAALGQSPAPYAMQGVQVACDSVATITGGMLSVGTVLVGDTANAQYAMVVGPVSSLLPARRIPADFDWDGDVDHEDFAIFRECATGSRVPYDLDNLPAACQMAADENGFLAPDFDKDGDIDLNDFQFFQICYSGPGRAGRSDCAQ